MSGATPPSTAGFTASRSLPYSPDPAARMLLGDTSMDVPALFTWGWGKDGQLGHGEKASTKAPRVVEAAAHNIDQLSCGGWHTVCLTSEGQLQVWGSGRCGQLGLGDWTDRCVAHCRRLA